MNSRFRFPEWRLGANGQGSVCFLGAISETAFDPKQRFERSVPGPGGQRLVFGLTPMSTSDPRRMLTGVALLREMPSRL